MVIEVAIDRDASEIDRQARVVLHAASGGTAVVELGWSYDGELKDVEIRFADGTTDRADLLRDYPGFKGSLWHEYLGVLRDFAEALSAGEHRADGGLPRAGLGRGDLPNRAADEGTTLIPEDGTKRPVIGTLVKVLLHRKHDRGMKLEPYASRCVRPGEVHELVTTDHTETAPGARIDRVAFVRFAEITVAGVIERGDGVWIDGRLIGTVLGFDACHFPNHYNILIATNTPRTGLDLALGPEASIRFGPPRSDFDPRRTPWKGQGIARLSPAGQAPAPCAHPLRDTDHSTLRVTFKVLAATSTASWVAVPFAPAYFPVPPVMTPVAGSNLPTPFELSEDKVPVNSSPEGNLTTQVHSEVKVGGVALETVQSKVAVAPPVSVAVGEFHFALAAGAAGMLTLPISPSSTIVSAAGAAWDASSMNAGIGARKYLEAFLSVFMVDTFFGLFIQRRSSRERRISRGRHRTLSRVHSPSPSRRV